MEFAEVEVGIGRRMGYEAMTVCPIGDVHYGAETCALNEFKEHLAWCLQQPNPWFLGMGDLVEYASPSNRGLLRAAIEREELYEAPQDALESYAQGHLEELAEILRPTKGRWLGMLGGDHFWKFNDGTTSDMRLCNILKAPYLGVCAIVKIVFRNKNKVSDSLHIWAHHGRGSGVFQAAPLNILERLGGYWEGIDVFICAHQHKQAVARIARLRPRFMGTGPTEHKVRRLGPGAGLVERDVILVGAGGFLKAHVEGTKPTDADGRQQEPKATYIEKRMKQPLSLGAPVITVEPAQSAAGRAYLRLRVTN